MRIHSSNKYFLKSQFTDFNESVVRPDAGTIQLTISDCSGNDIVTVPAVSDGDMVLAEVAELPYLGHYTAKWTATVDGEDIEQSENFELASRPYFKLSELVNWDPSASLDEKPIERLKRARDEAEDIIERNACVSFVPRGKTLEFNGDGTTRIMLPDVACRRIVSAAQNGSALDITTLKLHSFGAVDNPAGWNGRVVLNYEYGYDTTPEAIKTAALILATSKATLSGVPSRALSQNTDLGFVRFAIAGRDGATGIPEVDAIIEQYRRSTLAVG